MNETAKKLRDITQNAGVTPGSGKPYSVIAAIKSAFGFDSILAAGVLLQFMAAIADELDELQAKANDANNLRQKLDSAEKKAERRKKQVEHTEDAIRERNARLKMRAELLEQAVNENRELRKQVPTECERQILAMWPRFEDGEPVMVGAAVEPPTHGAVSVEAIEFSRGKVCVKDAEDGDWNTSMFAMHPLKRPETKVLDADGVEIHEGEILRGVGRSQHLFKVIDPHHIDPEVGEAFSVRCIDLDDSEWCHCRPELLTHTRPDSWERLEEDAAKGVCEYAGAEPCGRIDAHDCDTCRFYREPGKREGLICEQRMCLDIVRRAKALAGVEVG